MNQPPRPARPRRWLAPALLVFVLGACGLGGLLFRSYDQATDYPGATRLADDTLVRYTPNFVTKRTTVYRSTDPFNKVYNWYSVRFGLGPETYAQSNCILMSNSFSRGWGLDEQMSVMLCGTPGSQMMFVMRSFIFRYPRL